MAKFPEPPPVETLRRIGPTVCTLPAHARLWRVYCQGGAHPTTWDRFRAWGPTDARFDHQLPPPRVQEREILYVGVGKRGGLTALAECFQATRTIERERRSPALTAFDTVRPLALLDLTGLWPTRVGASAAISSGPRARARRWSVAIHEAWPELDGLLYASSMDGEGRCAALYERARNAMPPHPRLNRQLADPALLTVLRNAAIDLNYALV
jgi:hypothetical protein